MTQLVPLFFAFSAPPPSGTESTAPGWTGMLPIVLMVVIFYFLLIRPQQKKAKDHQALLKTVAHGDKVTTSSGIVGTVVGLKDHTVSIRSGDTKLEILKSAIAEITEKSSSDVKTES